MRNLEERIRKGLQETAQLIPEPDVPNQPAQSPRARGVLVAVGVALAVLVLFAPLAFIFGSDPNRSPANQQPANDSDIVPAEVGFEFANSEHVQLRFSQELTLECEGLETIDEGGFDSFDLDIWIDHRAGFTRLGFDYPDGSEHDLILRGRPGEWDYAWGSGADLGRDSGCRRQLEDNASEQSIAGWAFQDSSDLWFTAYLKPVSHEEDGVSIYHDGQLTKAAPVGEGEYRIETSAANGSQSYFEFTLDDDEVRVIAEERYILAAGHFEATASIEVLESGPTVLPVDIFDTSTFTPLWGDPPVETTAVAP